MDFDAWKKKRDKTIKTYLLFGTVFGIDNTLIPVTIVPYLRQIVSTDKATYYYSLSSIMFSVCSAIAATTMGRIVDRTRKVKYSLYFVLTCSMFGQFIYTFRLSPYMIVLARILCGVLSSEHYVLRGEIIRCYDEEDASKVLWWYTAGTSIGYIFGSWISLAFAGICFGTGVWKIDEYNFAGIFMVAICLINMAFVYLYASDCSKEYDLKSFKDNEKMKAKKNVNGVYNQGIANDKEIKSTTVDQFQTDNIGQSSNVFNQSVELAQSVGDQPTSIYRILIGFSRTPDIMLIMASTLLYAGVGYTSDLMEVIVVLNIFKWKAKYLNMVSGLLAMGMIFCTIFLSKYGVSNKQVYITSIIAIAFSFINMSLLCVIVSVPMTVNWQILLVVLRIITCIPIWQLDSVIFANMLGRMVTTNVQSFAESFRSILSLSSCIIVGIFIVNENYLKYMLYSLIGLIAVSLGIFIHMRKRLINIKLVNL